LRANADQVRQLQSQLNEILQRVDREFDDYPLALCRATRAGVITRANRAFGALLGCLSADAKRRLDLASELFDSSNELVWLVERSASSEDASSVECTRRRINGSRLILRLRAMPGPDAIHIVIEDLTPNWMLQEKLNRAQQMDAVGRLAAEVALTCVSFLRDVTEHGCRLIAMLEDGSEARRSGERMIGEVDRVASSLRQLAEYADDQAMSLDPVDLHQVLHDLEPILQKLAGDDIQVVLPERPPREEPPFNVDLTAQRVERLLINLARYGRGRTPSGGRMVFDVASTTVDGPFVAKYPNVRQGPHVLLTMTHARGGNGLVPSREAQASTAEGNESGTSVSGTPGIDLSALHGLVSHCGGHLWMDTDTTGEMKIEIHLPLRAA
jgi:signal transduction histidine kinase